jgi:putative effector of murein hydrolase
MPLSVCVILALLFLISSLLCLAVPLYLNFRHIHLAPKQNVQVKPIAKEVWGVVLGILAVDLLLYVLYRSAMPKSVFYPMLFGINMLCFSFGGYNFLTWRCYRKALRNGLQPMPVMDLARDMQSARTF